MVGLIGSSNNPVSGMAIATLIIATLLLKATGTDGTTGMVGAIAIGGVICIVAAIAGDTSQDLKTGFIVGATPKKQQLGEMLALSFPRQRSASYSISSMRHGDTEVSSSRQHRLP